MEIDISDALDVLSYEGPLCNEKSLKEALDVGADSIEFTELTSWLSKEIQSLCNLEDCVNLVTDTQNLESFFLEVSCFLKEMNCPFECLTNGPVNERLLSRNNRVILLEFLCSELEAAYIINAKRSVAKKPSKKLNRNIPSHNIQELLSNLNINVESSSNVPELFEQLVSKVDERRLTLPNVPSPLLKEELEDSQWDTLAHVQKDMQTEYTIRRDMLLTRLDVTVQSFCWGENMQDKGGKVASVYKNRRAVLNSEPNVDLSHLLAAREDAAIIEKTSSANLVKNTKSAVNTVLIGSVPDRGGRPKELTVPIEPPGWSNQNPSQGSSSWKQRGQGRGGRHQRGGKQFRGGGKNRRQ